MAHRKRVGSQNVEKCNRCRKTVKDDDKSGIMCDKCSMWFHGPCVSLTSEEVQWMGTKPNCLWVCDDCINVSLFDTEAKLTSILEKHESKIVNESMQLLSTKIEETVPKIIQETLPMQIRDNIEKALCEKLPMYKESVSSSVVNLGNKADTNLEIRISGLEEYKSKPNENISSAIINFETQQVEEVFDFLGEEKPDIKNIRRLGKRHTATDRPRTMLLTLSNPWAVRKILSKAPLLKNFKPEIANKIFISKSLTKDEQLKEKACLQKRWKLITEDGVNRKNISIRNFEVYVNGTRVEM